MPTVPLLHPARGLRRIRARSSALETALLRASVGALSAARPCCRHCHRTPLVGERVHVYAVAKRGEEVVCELCRPLCTAEPDRSFVLRSPEHLGSVRPVPART
jgi:hypothetical protein